MAQISRDEYLRLYEPSTTKKRTRRTAPDYGEYKRIREKFLLGKKLTAREEEKFRVEADLIAQDLQRKQTLNARDVQMWRSLPTTMQAEVKNNRAARIAKKYGISDWRKFATEAVPAAGKVIGMGLGAAAGGIPTGGIGAGAGATLGGTAGETLGNFAMALANKFIPGGPEDPKTFEDRERLRAEALLDYYKPGQERFYSPEEKQAIGSLEQMISRPRASRLKGALRSRLTGDYVIPEWLQSAVPSLQQLEMQPGAQESGAQQGITGLWNRIYGRRR